MKDYIYLTELFEKSKTKNISVLYSAIRTIQEEMGESVVTKVGGTLFIHKRAISKLPEKYRKAAKECTDLTGLRPASYITEIMDLSKDYIAGLISKEDKMKQLIVHSDIILDVIKIGKRTFVKLDSNFIHLLNIGYMPFRIRNKSDRMMADKIFHFSSQIEIGMYH